MILMRILPGVLKELLKHVPTVLFQVVEWHELTAELPILSKRIIKKEGQSDLIEKQNDLLSRYDIILQGEKIDQHVIHAEKWVAEKWLYIYFAQLYSTHGLFLDLRANHFKAEHPHLIWHPNGLWTKFNEDFRSGLLELYDGFYLQDEELYQKGLRNIGLVSDEWTQEEKERLGDLFKAQFGSSLDEEMDFNLEAFKSSIIKISDFLLTKKVTITNDFLYLGIYLVTLYSSLEQTEAKLPVKKIYLEVKETFGQAH